MVPHHGHKVSQSSVLQLLREDGLIPPAHYQRERGDLAGPGKAAFAQAPTGPHQVWQLDFSQFETIGGGSWPIAGCRDWFSKYEYRWHTSPTANQHEAIAAIELALADDEAMFGHPLIQACPLHEQTGQLLPALTIVTDNGGPFRSLNSELFITAHPELPQVRTRLRSPGQNGSRERRFGTLKYQRLFIDEIDHALALVEPAEDYRLEYNQLRPHQAIAWNRPHHVHLALTDPTTPTFEQEQILPTTRRGTRGGVSVR